MYNVLVDAAGVVVRGYGRYVFLQHQMLTRTSSIQQLIPRFSLSSDVLWLHHSAPGLRAHLCCVPGPHCLHLPVQTGLQQTRRQVFLTPPSARGPRPVTSVTINKLRNIVLIRLLPIREEWCSLWQNVSLVKHSSLRLLNWNKIMGFVGHNSYGVIHHLAWEITVRRKWMSSRRRLKIYYLLECLKEQFTRKSFFYYLQALVMFPNVCSDKHHFF